MKRLLLLTFFVFTLLPAFAKHIVGGEMIYQYLGPGTTSNTKSYRITLRLFRDYNCSDADCAQLPGNVPIVIYNNDTRERFVPLFYVSQTNYIFPLAIVQTPKCIVNSPDLKYQEGDYSFTMDLPDNATGYTATYQTCCRVREIVNGGGGQGANYFTEIPGNNTLGFQTDNSASFQTGVSIICHKKAFKLDFSAVDPDSQDSIHYELCDAYTAVGAANTGFLDFLPPPYTSITYQSGYSGGSSLGPDVFIDPNTGIISGIAPESIGKYVVAVCAYSYKNGVLMNVHRKDFLVTVWDCDFAGSELAPDFTNCKDSTFTFQNLNNSPLNLSYYWDFGDGHTSTEESPTYTYSDTGLYTIKLVVNRGTDCADSTTRPLRVFPKFIPDFTQNSPMCINIPVQFRDASFATYGPVDKWRWDFGNTAATNDTSHLKNPTYAYPAAGNYVVRLTSGSIKGCSDTVSHVVTIVNKAPLTITNDTLICNIDTLRISAVVNSPGTVTWSPDYMISDIHSFNPLVSPDVTTTYHVTYSDNFGCFNTDSVKVRVVDHVTLTASPLDTTICRTDPVQLQTTGDGLSYTWTPSATLSSATVPNPVAMPVAAQTTYHVISRIGKCFATEDLTVKTAPYPVANAGKDTSICFGFNAQLHATGGSIYNWSPPFFLTSATIADPISQAPTASLQYVVTVRDTKGCPKPVTDTIQVNVIRVIADAGPRDTAVVTGQPLQLHATVNIANATYTWSPATWLNNPNISGPISLPEGDIQYALLVRSTQGCLGRDTINVKRYTVKPDLYVPSAFTPNGDATNPTFKPIALGIRSLELFKVYNRWGEMVFSTTTIGVGWDGKYKGRGQETATYVWYAEATDYLGKKIKKKGTVVLIR